MFIPELNPSLDQVIREFLNCPDDDTLRKLAVATVRVFGTEGYKCSKWRCTECAMFSGQGPCLLQRLYSVSVRWLDFSPLVTLTDAHMLCIEIISVQPRMDSAFTA